MSTVGPAVARALAEAVERRGGALLDAPLSRSPVTIEHGQL
jgi:3-hydroxyisobutyrate dehydrogenase-like beta-hydroxyacid dehydrogenase